MRYSFLYEVNKEYLDIYARLLRIKLLGTNAELLRGDSCLLDMVWDGHTLINATALEWTFSKPRTKPDRSWPWPFRLLARPWKAEVTEFELYSVTGTLLFRAPLDVKHSLWPGDTLRIDPGDIKINISP